MLDYDIKKQKFWVLKRIEVPRGEYTLDNAVKKIIEVNKIYSPAWIFCDRGYGDYQIERLHIYGDEHPSTGLKHKVVGWQFSNTIEVPDPVQKTLRKEPLKPFMVNQLARAFERGEIILSPFDDTLHKQLTDYVVERISASGQPVYTSKEEHFVDALGLAYLAFVLKFPQIANAIKEIETTTKIEVVDANIQSDRIKRVWKQIQGADPWEKNKNIGYSEGERPGEYNKWIKQPLPKPGGVAVASRGSKNWGSRNNSDRMGGRSLW